MKNYAMTEYAINEINSIMQSVIKENGTASTSRSYSNAVSFWEFGGNCAMELHGYIDITLDCVDAEFGGENIVRFHSASGIGNNINVPTEQVLKWLEELSETQ